MKVFVVIPAYNEEKRIGQVLQDLSNLSYKIILVDDASSDATLDIARGFGVTLLKHRVNRGQGAALQTGNEYAMSHGADIIVHFDADGQFLVKEIKDIIKPIIDEDCDIVFGSRFLNKKSNMPWSKANIIHPLARMVNRIFMGIKLSDSQSGFRAMTVRTAKKIVIEQDGMAHCSEIMAKSFQYNLRIKEVPMTVIYHEFGQGLSGGFKILHDLFINKFLK